MKEISTDKVTIIIITWNNTFVGFIKGIDNCINLSDLNR